VLTWARSAPEFLMAIARGRDGKRGEDGPEFAEAVARAGVLRERRARGSRRQAWARRGLAAVEIAPHGRTWAVGRRRPGPPEPLSMKSGAWAGQGSPHLGERGRAEIWRGRILCLTTCAM